jgi:hypothetical protein
MSSTQSMQTDAVPSTDVTRALAATPAVGSTWKSLYKIGAAAALFGVAMIPIPMIVFIVWPPPDTAIGWFTLFQNSAIAGLLAFECLFIVNAVLGILTALALYIWGLYVPKIGLFLSILSVVPLAIWLILIARRLFQLGQGGSQEVVNQKLSLGAARSG